MTHYERVAIASYTELDVLCLVGIIALVLLTSLYFKVVGKPVSKLIRGISACYCVYLLTDTVWGCFKYYGNYVPIVFYIVKTVYFAVLITASSWWLIYVCRRLNYRWACMRVGRIISMLPAALMCVLAVISPMTGILYDPGDMVHLHKGPAYPLYWVINASYLVIASLVALIKAFRVKGIERVQSLILAAFAVPALLCAYFQDLWDVNTSCVGYTVSIMVIFVYELMALSIEHARAIENTQNLYSHMPLLAFTKSTKTGKYISCNQNFAEYVGLSSPEEIVGLSGDKLFNEETSARIAEDDRRVLASDEPVVITEYAEASSGEPRFFQTTKMKYTDTEGNPCLLGMSIDITQTIELEHQKNAAEAANSAKTAFYLT